MTVQPSRWSDTDLNRVGAATELQVAPRRSDGSLSSYTTIWVVRAGEDIYVRSAHGADNPWFRRAVANGTGRIRAAGIERDVEFTRVPDGVNGAVDAAYHAKYDRYGPQIVGSVVGPHAALVTLRVDPSDQPA